jgi:hypothetical protein
MGLLGSAAMVLSFDIEPEAVDEHDDWHTREHLPERLAIPGFLRGSRWKAVEGEPRYLVLYEVADLGVLGSAGYLERLDNPTPWTQKMMKSYRGMRRGFCRVAASCGAGLGGSATLARFTPAPQREAALRDWLVEQVLPGLAALAGVASAHLFQAAGTPAMTAEQQIRGRDRDFGWVLLATGYRLPPAAPAEQFMQHGGAEPPQSASYRLECLIGRGASG